MGFGEVIISAEYGRRMRRLDMALARVKAEQGGVKISPLVPPCTGMDAVQGLGIARWSIAVCFYVWRLFSYSLLFVLAIRGIDFFFRQKCRIGLQMAYSAAKVKI